MHRKHLMAMTLSLATGLAAHGAVMAQALDKKQEAYLNKVVRAVGVANGGNAADACKQMRRLRKDALFDTLPADLQAAVQGDAGYVYLLCEQPAEALPDLKAAVAADPDMALTANLAVAAEQVGEWDTCARAMITLATRWPDKLDDTWARRAWSAYRNLGKTPALQRELFKAFFDARFDYVTGDASAMWYELARLSIDAGDSEGARAAAARVIGGESVMRMRVDRRFDAVVSRDAPGFDARLQGAALVDKLRRQAAAHPRDLDAWVQLSYAQLDVGDHQAVIDDTTRVLNALAPVMTASGDAPGWEDTGKRMWLMNNRAIAHARMGNLDLAIADLRKASVLPEYGGRNVSQMLNLGTLLCYAGRPAEAVQQVTSGLGNLAPYGRLVQGLALLCAAAQRDDRAEMARLSNVLVSTAGDSGHSVRLEAHLWTGDLQAAEREYLQMLADPGKRSDALLYAQQGNRTPGMPGRAILDRNRDALLARPAVVAKINEVGRVEKVDLYLGSVFE